VSIIHNDIAYGRYYPVGEEEEEETTILLVLPIPSFFFFNPAESKRNP